MGPLYKQLSITNQFKSSTQLLKGYNEDPALFLTTVLDLKYLTMVHRNSDYHKTYRPKKTPREFRLIHHLSFPEESLINHDIPQQLCFFQYQSIDTAISII